MRSKPSLIKTLWQFIKGKKKTFWTDKDLFSFENTTDSLILLHKSKDKERYKEPWNEIVSIPLNTFHSEEDKVLKFFFDYISLSVSCSQLLTFIDKTNLEGIRYLQIGDSKYYLNKEDKDIIEVLVTNKNSNEKIKVKTITADDNPNTILEYFIDILNDRWAVIESNFNNLVIN